MIDSETEQQKTYRSVLTELGIPAAEQERRLQDTFQTIFYGPDRFYTEASEDMGYLMDTGNLDVRTEGMSYGMMMCVQLDKPRLFDKLWKWARTYMYQEGGRNPGTFAWSVDPSGVPNARGPAPDGEEYFAMALFFASHRWGDRDGIFAYGQEARALLRTLLHQEDRGTGRNFWDKTNHLIRFVPEADFTDPSYHLPHFYELFALWADPEDRLFWQEAAEASRKYLQTACHPDTGLSPEYAAYDGTPWTRDQQRYGRHDWHYSDAYRTIANIAMDYLWFGRERGETWHLEIAEKLRRFFLETVSHNPRGIYAVDGTELSGAALHPLAITATLGESAIASPEPLSGRAKRCAEAFWAAPLRRGERRYYDNCLSMFALLALSGRYRIW